MNSKPGSGRPAMYLALVGLSGVLATPDLSAQSPDPSLECRTVESGRGGRYVCTGGTTGPTVVFEAGMRDDHRVWDAVAPRVASFARVVTYDRAGNGASPPAPAPRTPEAIARELRELLDGIDAEGPFLLVAHSAGGWHVRAFAGQFPDQVSGMILLDSPHEDFEVRRLELLDERERADRIDVLERSRARLPQSIRDEYAGIESTRGPRGDLPDIPLLVVTVANHEWGPTAKTDQLETIWQDLQRRLSRLAPRGRLLVVERGGHQIPREQPDRVVEWIAEIMGRSDFDPGRNSRNRRGRD